jgi:hypothetical protein
MISLPLAALIMAIAYRLRGHRPTGGLLNRLMHPVFVLRPGYALITVAVLHHLIGLDPTLALTIALAEYAGLHIPHAGGQDFGSHGGTPTGDAIHNALVGGVRGTIVTAALLLVALLRPATTDPEPLILLALLMPVANAAAEGGGRLAGFAAWNRGLLPHIPHIARGHLEWQEILVGLFRIGPYLLLLGLA